MFDVGRRNRYAHHAGAENPHIPDRRRSGWRQIAAAFSSAPLLQSADVVEGKGHGHRWCIGHGMLLSHHAA